MLHDAIFFVRRAEHFLRLILRRRRKCEIARRRHEFPSLDNGIDLVLRIEFVARCLPRQCEIHICRVPPALS